ncbi:TRAP transporter small permease [Microbaculum marinum]|uniref:TRAP transporter small permease protein n=1 Tax=Microbaculum marinum TaxID=1764581 RepID=A0AAW9RCJ9_9HYPH
MRLKSVILTASAAAERICLLAAMAALAGMVGAVMLQIVARYGFSSPPSWTEELARYLMVWGGLLGATVAFRRGSDPVIVQADAFRVGWSRAVRDAALAVTTVIFLAPVLYYCFFGPDMAVARSFLVRNAARTSDGLGLNLAVIAASIPVTVAVIFLHLAARLAGASRPAGS